MKITKSGYRFYGYAGKYLAVILMGVCILGGCGLNPQHPEGEVRAADPGKPGTEITSATEVAAKFVETPGPASTHPDNEKIWLDATVPDGLRALMTPDILVGDEDQAMTRFGASEGQNATTRWVFALAAPFPTLEDEFSLEDVRQIWQGQPLSKNTDLKIYLSKSTLAAFEPRFGKPSNDRVIVKDPDGLLAAAWEEKPSIALLPFEELSPRWKVLRVDGISPLDLKFSIDDYPLVIAYGFTGSVPFDLVELPNSNRMPERLTSVLLSGTTALVRATGAKMEKLGMSFPARDILPWIENSDLVHISNEVSFLDYCPPANAYSGSLLFCSRPEYVELLETIGTDIVELTGNHLVDYSREAFVKTLKMYKDRGMVYYGGGMDLTEAQKPLMIEHNGNKLAFLGCNSSGPPTVWAEDDRAGAAPCDYDQMIAEIRSLKKRGYLPIVTLQHYEYYIFYPAPLQVRDFNPLAEAGAVIVSGSQSHYPQGFAFVEDSFIHYGLGNLFFDQMWMPVPASGQDLIVSGTRREFLDRHVFYDGKYIGTEVLTALLEEFARPRPMTLEERRDLLSDAFNGSQW